VLFVKDVLFLRDSLRTGRDRKRTLRRLRRVLIRKRDIQLEQTALPQSLGLSRNTAFPTLQIKDTVGVSMRPGVEPKRVVSSPLFSLLRETILAKRHRVKSGRSGRDVVMWRL
jgi:hypothetical protein